MDSRRIPLEDVCIVVPADASVVRYGDSCLPALLYLLERHFRSFEVRLCEVGGRHFEHLETKNNIVYRSVPDGSVSRASRLVEQAASETRRPRLLVVPLTRDAERDFGRARGALDAIRAGKVPPELESREAILATAAGREARTGPRPAQVAESSGPAAASAGPPAIYVAFDDAFAELARTCLASLERNWPDHPVVLVDYAGAGGTDLGWLDARPRVRRLPEVEPPRFTQGLADGPVGSPMVHRRFRLWTPEFDAYGPILHLDVDTLVLGPLAELFESDEFFIVSNHEPTPYVRVFDPIFEHDLTLQRLLAEDGFAYPHAMDDLANAGVFVLPRRLRNEEELARLERIAGRYARYLAYADQSVISLWCAQRGLAFSTDYRFNYQAAFVNDPSVEARLEDARILHFTTHRKPGTPEFARWDRLEGHHARLEALFREYRGLALSGGAAAR